MVIKDMMTGIADEMLMQQYAQGDVQAFSQLYTRHKNSLYRYFLRQVSTPELAEELYQEVWSKLIKASPSYQVQSKFSTWLYRIAHNELIDYYRRHTSQNKVFSTNVEQIEHPSVVENGELDQSGQSSEDFQSNTTDTAVEDDIYATQQIKQVKWCLQQLPREQKEAFLLKHESGFTVNEIASLVGESHDSIKSRIRYGLNKLKHCVMHNMRKFYE